MSFMDRVGRQIHPDEYEARGALAWDDALTLARAVVKDGRLSEGERLRLMWAAMDAAEDGGTV